MITIEKPEKKNKLTTINREILVITHDGLFHSDEVFSVALLRLYYSDIKIIRTRDSELLIKAINDREVFVLDVGNAYDPQTRNFDHHQMDAPEGLSTISLLFFHLFPDFREDDRLSKIYNRLIKGINEWDQGKADRILKGHPLHLPQLISGFNRFGMPNQDTQFLKAVDFAYKVLANEMNTAKEMIRSEEVWKKKEVLGKQVALLDEYCTFWRIVQGEEKHYKYIAQPDLDNWSVMSVDSELHPLPEVTGNTNGLVFQHKDRFITVFNNYQSAINYINQYLTTNN